MTTSFNEAAHPRETTGKFAEKTNSAPVQVLTEIRRAVPGADDHAAAARIAQEFAVEHLIDSEDESAFAAIGFEMGEGLGYEDTIETLMARAYAAGRADATEPGPLRLTDIVADATVMGGDEIRDLPPRQLTAAHAMAVRGAARLQAYMEELGLNVNDDVDKLRVVDLGNLQEKDLASVFIAAQNRNGLNAAGTIRTRADLENELAERDVTDEETVEKVWQHYVTEDGWHDYDEALGEKEYRTWVNVVEASYKAVADGWEPKA